MIRLEKHQKTQQLTIDETQERPIILWTSNVTSKQKQRKTKLLLIHDHHVF